MVYHASYLRFMERGRTEYIRSLGVDQMALFRETGFSFVVRRMTLEWLAPARMDDVLDVETRAERVRGASIELAQRVMRGADVLVTATVLVAGVREGRPARLPDALRARFAAAQGGAE